MPNETKKREDSKINCMRW